ncbi:hypothetical protein EK21DRAFT_84916 [Setomelanomma holmii]|uniref:Uncharacterized protein n=1 Tax=Setomelanomma holmii TaxID=210430 RepID=A0A9P4HLS1_9PLEO|nr:hypothetical protein EK21DRAFT_84916 [Setomelanomma holmii]
MQLYSYYAFIVFVACAALAAPTASFPATSAAEAPHIQYFFLRANCPQEPWHGRNVVALPTSQRLGLENFTVSPITPGLNFRPISLANGRYALRGEGDNDVHNDAPYLVALKPLNGTQITGMIVLYLPTPDGELPETAVVACPDDFDCTADQWTFDAAGGDMVHPNFKFARSEGDWEPNKDAAPEGWHVYWRTGGDLYHPITVDLVPSGENGCSFLECHHLRVSPLACTGTSDGLLDI